MSQGNLSPATAATSITDHQRYRLPRFRDKKQQLITPKVGEEVPYDPPLPSSVHVWDSGPVLVANQTNRESVNYNVPGEGKVLRTLEEGSRVWKNKTVRTYHETVPKSKQITNSRTNDDTTLPRKSIQSSNSNNNNNNNSIHSNNNNNNNLTSVTGKTSRYDDDKVTSSKLHHDSRVTSDTLIKRRMSPSPNRRILVSPSTNQFNYDTTTPRYLYASHSRLNSPDRHSNLSSVSHRLVPMEDKSIQCNLKKELKDHSNHHSSSSSFSKKYDLRDDFKVIKSNTRDGSVSVFSDVSLLDEDESKKKDPLRKETVVYSTIETHTPTETIRTREMASVSREKDYLYRDRVPLRDRTIDVTRSISRPTSRSDYSPSPTRTRVVTKTYGVNMATDMGPDVTSRSSPLHSSHRNDSSYRSTTPRSWHQDVSTSVSPRNNEMVSPSRSRNIAHETIEETISISNASSDELIDSHHEAHARAVESVLLNDSSNVHNMSHTSNTGTLLNDRTKHSNNADINGPRELLSSSSRISEPVDGRGGVSSASPRNYSTNNSSLWFNKPVDEDYRKSMVASPLDVVGNTIGVKDDHERFCSATLSRREPYRYSSSNSHDTAARHSATGETVHAYTLDRKHLDRRKKALSTFGGSHLGSNSVSFEPLGGPPGFRKAPSLPEKESTPGIRRFASTRDISGYQSEAGGTTGHGYRRGGLAAAFKERQARASSLNRSIERNYHGSSVSLAPHHSSTGGGRNNYSNEFRPRTRSFHDSQADPAAAAVHYVPIKTSDGGAPLNRHQSILQKKHEAKLASKSKEQRSSPGVVTFASHGKQYSVHPADSDEIERKKKDLKRSQSIPKDTKFPWLARLKMKVKARDP